MREYTADTTIEVPLSGNVTDDLVDRALATPDLPLVARSDADRQWHDVTAAEFLAEVRAVAQGLVAAGIEAGDRVGLVSRTRYEWTLLDYAVWFAGAVSVPLYPTSSAEQMRLVLADSGAVAVVAEDQNHLSRITDVRDELPQLRHVWTIEGNAVDVLTRLGADVPAEEVERRRSALGPDDVATLMYTSGTTGDPRGCRITHRNFACELAGLVGELPELFEDHDGQPSTLLFLPLAHVFTRVVQLGAVRAGVRLGHAPDLADLTENLRSFRPTFVTAVPRVWEKLFNTASQQATADGRGATFDRAATAAIAYSRALDKGRPSVAARARHAVFDRLVYARLRELLGGRCSYVISGGAPLGERLGHFYRGIGVTVLEGYGLAETTGAVVANLPTAHKVGAVGRPLPGVSVRVADDGELLVRGGQIFDGYWSDEAATAEVFDGAWLRTGDLGEVDAEGFVRITGRKKEILVTAGGKNVSPALLEERLRAHPLVAQALVVGDGRPYIAALLTLDRDGFASWKVASGRSGSVADLVDDPELRAEAQKGVDAANEAVSQAESVRKFVLLAEEWTEEGGHLTPSLKLKRTVVTRGVQDDIARLYL